MCNIIIENGAIQNLKQYITTNYESKVVGLIINKNNLNKYRNYLKIFKNLNLTMQVFFFELNKCTNIAIAELCNDMKNCNHIVCIGEDVLVDITKAVANNLNVGYSVVPTMVLCNIINNYYKLYTEDELIDLIDCAEPTCVYVDTNIICNTTYRQVASAFAGVLSLNINICKMLYSGYTEQNICSLNAILKQINMFTTQNIVTLKGKQQLFKIILEAELLLNKLNIKNSLNKIVYVYSKFNNTELNMQEKSLILTLLILTFHEKILKENLGVSAFSIAKRVNRLKELFNSDKLINNVVNNISTNNTNYKELAEKKDYYTKYITLALNRVVNNISMLKRIYVDKGVIYKGVDISKYINSLSLACDIVNEKYLFVLIDLGVMDCV